MTLTIRIPGKIDPDLSPNARVHHMRRYRAAKAAREAGYWAAVEQFMAGMRAFEHDARIRYDVTIGLAKGEKRKDSDNAASMTKSLLDGIADGLGFMDDRQFRLGTVEQVRDVEGVGYVEFRLTEITGKEQAA